MPELSPEEIEKLREAFTLFDKDGDGFISIEDLACIMRKFGKDPSEDLLHVNIYFKLREILKNCDLSKNCCHHWSFRGFILLVL